MKDKEKLVKDLVNTFNDRDELHIVYKEKMKGILESFIYDLGEEEGIDSEKELKQFISDWVELRFRPEK